MTNTKTRKLVLAALMCALTTVGTMMLVVPTPLGGYVHAGDVVVLLSAFLLGPVYAAVAAGIGAAIADILVSYAIFAPATLIVKAAMAVTAYFVFTKLRLNNNLYKTLIAGIVAIIPLVLGYFLYQAYFMGMGLAAAVDIPANIIQGAFATVCASLLYSVLIKNSVFKSMTI